MQAPYHPNYVGEQESPPPKKVRLAVASKDVLGDNVDLKKMLGILIILMIVVFFTILIGIVVTLMKPGCKCMSGAMQMPPSLYAPPGTGYPMLTGLPFV